MSMFERMLAYIKESNEIGEVANINLITKSISVKSNDIMNRYDFDDVIILERAFVLKDEDIFDRDVLGDAYGNTYLVELHDDGHVQLHLLDKDMEISESGAKGDMTDEDLEFFETKLVLVGNYYEMKKTLENNKSKEFNVEIVKYTDDEDNVSYFYACNNKDEELVDLIKVVFLGHELLEEDYERITITYDEYSEYDLEKVSASELQRYAMSKMSGVYHSEQSESNCDEDECCNEDEYRDDYNYEAEDIEESFSNCALEGGKCDCTVDDIKCFDEVKNKNKCEDCENPQDECDCDLW